MNKILLLFLFSLSVFSFAFAQGGKDDMITALKSGNADQFVKYLDNNVDVKLPGSNEMKSVPKAQATATVKSFFTENKIISCTITSQRENGGTMYVAGKLNGTGSYNITVMVKSDGNNADIITLRINN